MGRKVSDKFAVPICRLHHRELHRCGNERVWWQNQGIDPLVVAATLWARTHGVPSVAVGSEGDRPAEINGRLYSTRVGAAARTQNDGVDGPRTASMCQTGGDESTRQGSRP